MKASLASTAQLTMTMSFDLTAVQNARAQAKEAGAFEAWFVDRDGFVTEGTSSSAFIVDASGVIRTRALSNDLLHGVTRAVLLKLAHERQMRVSETPFTVDEAKTAREAFISAASNPAIPVVAVDGAPNPSLGSAVTARDLPAGIPEPAVVFDDGTIRVSAISVEHFQIPPVGHLDAMPTAVAYRVEAGGRSLVYSGDTGPTGQLAKLARGADVLFSEVVDIPSIEASLRHLMPQAPPERVAAMARNMSRNHLEPEAIGRIAADAGVKRVVLTHYVPGLEAMRDPQGLVRRVGSRYPGPVSLAHDLDRF